MQPRQFDVLFTSSTLCVVRRFEVRSRVTVSDYDVTSLHFRAKYGHTFLCSLCWSLLLFASHFICRNESKHLPYSYLIQSQQLHKVVTIISSKLSIDFPFIQLRTPLSLEASRYLLLFLLLSFLLQLLPLPLSSIDASLSIPQQCIQTVLL